MRHIPDYPALLDLANRLVCRSRFRRADDPAIEALQKSIAEGDDPLGESYTRIVSPEDRRQDGSTFTPFKIVDAMVRWAQNQELEFARIVDPGAGSGRFVLALSRAFPKAEIIAVERNPDIANLLRANLLAADLKHQVKVLVEDYRSVSLDRASGPTLFIGNPPYVRHHNIERRWKNWYANGLKRYALSGSQLAGLHLHFLLKTRQLAVAGDAGCFITAAEWLDVNYGSALRCMLTDGLGGQSLHLIDKTVKVFDNALTSAVILCFMVGSRRDTMRVRHVRSTEHLGDLNDGEKIPFARIVNNTKWTTLAAPPPTRPHGRIELGELFAVHRGQVTGMNSVWIAGQNSHTLPERVLVPTITDAKELIHAPASRLATTDHLQRVVSLPHDFAEFELEERIRIEDFLKWAKSQRAHESYIARHRKPWWRVTLGRAAPIVMTYMARRPPVFVHNICQARILNIAHGLYPRGILTDQEIYRIVRWLNTNVCTSEGRTYAGGLVKFEPGEVMRLRIPALDELQETT